MTFDPADLSHYSSPRRTSIVNANGVVSPVTRAGSVTLSPSLQLFNTLLAPSLSHKLLFGETLDKELKWLTFKWFEDQNDKLSKEEPLAAELIPFEEEGSPLLTAASPFPDNIPKVSNIGSPSIINAIDAGYNLPFRQNRGKPPNKYSPEIEERRSRYPIANYVSTEKLPEPLKIFSQELSTCHIPTTV
ncbi:hypothetical protein AB3S75_000463 [Citrus x aurantiifolia]